MKKPISNCNYQLAKKDYINIIRKHILYSLFKKFKKERKKTPSLPCEILLYINHNIQFFNGWCPSLPCEYVLYINIRNFLGTRPLPSLPYEILLYINLKQWHYRLLINFNLFTNEESMISIHLHFRHFCQGP